MVQSGYKLSFVDAQIKYPLVIKVELHSILKNVLKLIL